MLIELDPVVSQYILYLTVSRYYTMLIFYLQMLYITVPEPVVNLTYIFDETHMTILVTWKVRSAQQSTHYVPLCIASFLFSETSSHTLLYQS